MRNTQSPESKAHHLETLDVQEIFPTLQGEGPNCGLAAVFIRLAGCNLQCPGCDTDYTSKRHRLSIDAIAAEVVRTSGFASLVVITGGEPLRQNIAPLCEALIKLAYRVQIETNGTLPIPGSMPREVEVVCSPKTGSIHQTVAVWPKLALKYVIKSGDVDITDGLPVHALDHSCHPRVARPPIGFTGPVYVQPMDEDAPAYACNLQAAVDSCMQYGHRLQLQIHKIIGVA